MPERVQLARLRRVLRAELPAAARRFHDMARRMPVLAGLREVLSDAALRGPFDLAMVHYAQQPTTLYVGSFLHAFQHKLRW